MTGSDVTEDELKAQGWAPGGYTLNCTDEAHVTQPGDDLVTHLGAKRSGRCHACATRRAIEARSKPAALSQARAVPDGERLAMLERFVESVAAWTHRDNVTDTERLSYLKNHPLVTARLKVSPSPAREAMDLADVEDRAFLAAINAHRAGSFAGPLATLAEVEAYYCDNKRPINMGRQWLDHERSKVRAAIRQLATSDTEGRVEAAAKAMYESDPAFMDSAGRERWTWQKSSPDSKAYWRGKAAVALRVPPPPAEEAPSPSTPSRYGMGRWRRRRGLRRLIYEASSLSKLGTSRLTRRYSVSLRAPSAP